LEPEELEVELEELSFPERKSYRDQVQEKINIFARAHWHLGANQDFGG
jgi:hypothetical protein